MAQTIRWGFLGAGFAARQFARGLRVLADAQLLAVSARTRAEAAAFAGQFAVPRVYEGPEELAADRDLDIVYVATPPARHRDDCLCCLEAGKPVLCEKPFTVNSQQAEQVARAAQQKNLFCMEAMWMRFMPLVMEAGRLLQGGSLGHVHLLAADFGVPVRPDPEHRLFRPELGGGALLDRGVYGISLAQYLLGPVHEVSGQATIGQSGVDVQCTAVLRHAAGAISVVSASLCAWTCNEAHVSGSEGHLVLHEPFYRPERLSLRRREIPAEEDPSALSFRGRLRCAMKNWRLARALHLRLQRALGANLAMDRVQPIEGNGYNYEAAEAMRCLRAGKLQSELNPLTDTISVMHVMDQLRRQWGLRYPGEE